MAIKRSKHYTVNQDLFLREARAASQLSHPNIVRIFDVGEFQGTAYIVSEFVDGHTLRHWIHKNQPSFDVVCEKCGIIADAIASAHDNDVIHRDLKPGNIMMDTSGQPRIVDFGLSHSRNSGFDTLLIEGRPIGTPAYMAPEQVKGQSDDIGTWSDVYSLGTVLYQMLTGRLPFAGNSREVLDAIISDTPPLPRSVNSQIPVPLEAICLKAIAKKREDRYQTCRELAMELRSYQNGRKLVAYPGMYPRRAKTVFRRNFMAGTASICGLLLTGGSYWAWQDHQSRNPLIPVMIDSDPPGAKLSWLPFNFETGEFADQPAVVSVAGELEKLPPGFYKVQAVTRNESFEVFRTIPISVEKHNRISFLFNGTSVTCPHRWSNNDNGTIQLKPITIVPEASVVPGMIWFSMGNAIFPDSPVLMHLLRGKSRKVGRFLMDSNEVTWQEMERVFRGLKPHEGCETSDPATGIPLDVALSYCELSGKNLPTVYEFQYAATNGGTTRYPWGNELRDDLENHAIETGWDDTHSTPANPAVKNLFAGVSEWTETPFVVTWKSSGSEEVTSAQTASTLGPGRALSLFPESWLYVSGGGHSWVDNIHGIGPRSPGAEKQEKIGFRTVRRLSSSK